MTTWSLRRIWRNQCAREVKNITTNKKDIHTELRLFTLDFSESFAKETTVGWIIVLNLFYTLFLTLSSCGEAAEL